MRGGEGEREGEGEGEGEKDLRRVAQQVVLQVPMRGAGDLRPTHRLVQLRLQVRPGVVCGAASRAELFWGRPPADGHAGLVTERGELLRRQQFLQEHGRWLVCKDECEQPTASLGERTLDPGW